MAIKHTKTAVPDVDKVDCTDWNADHTAEEDPIFTAWDKDHIDLSNVLPDQHHAQAHTLASHSTKDHSELTNVTADQHHNESHTLASHSTKDHSELTNVTANQHHNEAHTLASHSTKAHTELTNVTANQHHTPTASGDIDHDATVNTHNLTNDIDHDTITNTHNLTTDISHDSISDVSADDHHNEAHTLASHSTKAHTELTGVTSDQHHAKSHAHDGIDGSGTIAHSDTTGRTANDHHNESHNAASHSDITSTGAQIDDAVSKRHTQNTDSTLATGAVAKDHGAAATDQIINVSYGTGDPPTANTTTIGSLFVKYTA